MIKFWYLVTQLFGVINFSESNHYKKLKKLNCTFTYKFLKKNSTLYTVLNKFLYLTLSTHYIKKKSQNFKPNKVFGICLQDTASCKLLQ